VNDRIGSRFGWIELLGRYVMDGLPAIAVHRAPRHQ
jgi:hypothetical protein